MKYYDEYCEWLNEIHTLEGIACNSFSTLLERGDPIAFNCGYDDYLNATDKEED